MDARRPLEDDMIFSYSNHSTAAIFSKTKSPSFDFGQVSNMAVHNALERSSTERTNSLMQSLSEDTDIMSDAESSCYQVDADEDEDDAPGDEKCIDDLLNNEGVRKKLELLAEMVGVDNSEPEVLLAAVVRVIEDLNDRCFSSL